MEILTASSQYLAQKNVPSAGLASKLLLSKLLGCPHLELSIRYSEELPERYVSAMRRGIQRVAAGEPVQYVIGDTGFMGHTFKVDRRALIPRPETESLVEKVLADRAMWDRESPRCILDIGTGSGCIIISLALAVPTARNLAVDLSEEALELARENAGLLGVSDRITFFSEDLSDVVEPESVHLVVSNPPYIPVAECEKLPVWIRDHEPYMALDGGPDGLSVIKQVVQDAAVLLCPGGRIYLEIGETQGEQVRRILETEGFEDIEVSKDLNQKDRIVRARIQGSD